MAESSAVEIEPATRVDDADHERMYRGFLTLIKWSVITVVIILMLMALFLL